jgi:hypothetical protein
MANKRKNYSAQGKVGLLRQYLVEKEPVSHIRHSVAPLFSRPA